MEKNDIILSLKNVEIKFNVRGKELNAIRNISLDIYENESLAIVGESGSGKSVLMKALSGMLDSNGKICNGEIILKDLELQDTKVKYTRVAKKIISIIKKVLDKYAKLELGADVYRDILHKEEELKKRITLSAEEDMKFVQSQENLKAQSVDLYNNIQRLDRHKEKEEIHQYKKKIRSIQKEIRSLNMQKKKLLTKYRNTLKKDIEYKNELKKELKNLKISYYNKISQQIKSDTKDRNEIIAKEIYLSVGRYTPFKRLYLALRLVKALKHSMKLGIDLENEENKNKIFDTVVFRVNYIKETDNILYGMCNLDLTKIKYTKDWQKIRGSRIATIFQDPMTSLNPIIPIGKQITSIILKHQKCSFLEAKKRALVLMKKVGISNPEDRFNDYPFQYSGGMRQRIVIAIALSCQPKILICDEPTTALDVTIQAQILNLIKELQKEFKFTIIFITHDLGVVANIATRVAVLYAGQIVEIGTCEEVFFDSRHPYTWSLLSSLPQLSKKGETLYSIRGTPPSLYSRIVGDAFAPRNPYCLKIDTIKEPPIFRITDTHFAKTWLLDERAPKGLKPKIIQDLHKKLLKAFKLDEVCDE